MSSLARATEFIKKTTFTDQDRLFVGVDVHKKSYHVSFCLNNTPTVDFVMPADEKQLVEKLQPLRPGLRQVVYETGPTGYGLARCLIREAIPTAVVATSRIPKLPGYESKTDRMDSGKLAAYAAKGLMRAVAIPTPKQEADRQLFRMRARQVRHLSRVKTQIKSFLLMHGIKEPEGLGHWSRYGIATLRTLSLQTTLRLSLDELLADLDYYTTRVKRLNQSLAQHLDQGILSQRIKILKTHPGVGSVVACQFATELYHYQQFPNTRTVYRYLGLSPTLQQSGDRSVRGPINKAS